MRSSGVVLLFSLCLLAAAPAGAAEATVFQFCYEDRELLPYYRGSGQLVPKENPGETIEAILALDQRMDGIEIRLHREPWKRCLAMLKKGITDGVIASYKKEREKIGIYPKKEGEQDYDRAFSLTSYCLFRKRQGKLSWDGEQFGGSADLHVAVPRGYSIIGLLNEHQLPFEEVDSSAQALRLLHKERVSGAVTLCDPGRQILDQHPEYSDVIEHSPPLSRKGGYLLVSRQFYRDHQQTVEEMWLKLVDIRDEMGL